MLAFAITSGLTANSAQSAEPSGSLVVKSAGMDLKTKKQLIGLDVWFSDNDGITSSAVTCVNLAGREVFSLSFKFGGSSYAIYKSKAGTQEVPLRGVYMQSRSSDFDTRIEFSVAFQGTWKSDDQCMASLGVTDKLGSRKDVATIPITFKEYLNPELNKESLSKYPEKVTPVARTTYKPDGVKNVFGCLLTGQDRNRIPEGLPSLQEGMSCGSLAGQIKGGSWPSLYPPGVLIDSQQEYLTWRIAFGDIVSTECKYTYDPRVVKSKIADAKKDATALCNYIRKTDSRIKTKVTSLRKSSPYGATLDLEVKFKTREK